MSTFFWKFVNFVCRRWLGAVRVIVAWLGLFDGGAGENIKLVGIDGSDARENFIIGSGSDHGGVVAGEFRLREKYFGVCKVFLGF